MNDDMKRLIRVQEIISAIDAMHDKVAAVPAEVARLEKELLAAQKDVETEKARVQELGKDRRRLEMELMGIESKITKYQAQLADVKTNKEYQAILHEVEACRKERAACDDKILVEMEESETRNTSLLSLEETLARRRRETTQGKVRLDSEAQELKRRADSLETERAALEAGVSADYLQPFLKVARQRKGLALVAVREERCGGCHVRVMPKLIQQVRRATGLIACDSCKRFLYVPDGPSPTPDTATESPAR